MSFLFPKDVRGFNSSQGSDRNLASGRQSKRPRLDPGAAFDTVLQQGGCRLITPSDQPLEVEDPRRLRKYLMEHVASSEHHRESFLKGLEGLLQTDLAMLHKMLLPLQVLAAGLHATGDSLVRILLNIPVLQGPVSTLLLEKLPEFSGTEEGPDGDPLGTIPGLILAQMRWLEVVVDSRKLTEKILEVLPVCSAAVQKLIVGLLPEVVGEEDYQDVCGRLEELLVRDLGFTTPVLDAITNMQLPEELQDHLVGVMLQHLNAVDVEDLGPLLRFLLQGCTAHNVDKVLTDIRKTLHFVAPSDPRLAVPDVKQKGPLIPRGDSPAALAMRQLTTSLQVLEVPSEAYMKLLSGLTEPSQHKVLDLWVLLVLWGKSSTQQKMVEGLLRKKLIEGQVGEAWFIKGIQGHQAVLKEFWPAVRSLAERLARMKEGAISSVATRLYVLMFVNFDSTGHRQEVLQCLHGHLGSGAEGEVGAAINALLLLAQHHTAVLVKFGSFLTNILDYLEGFSDLQLGLVFKVFALMMNPLGDNEGGSGPTGTAGGGRLEDEVHITISKALGHVSPTYKRIGIIGSLALLRRTSDLYGALPNTDGEEGKRLFTEWTQRLEFMFTKTMALPACFAFLLDQLTIMVGSSSDQLVPACGLPNQGSLHQSMGEWLQSKVQDLFETTFLDDVVKDPATNQPALSPVTVPQPRGSRAVAPLPCQLWFNLDGELTPVYLKVLPLLANPEQEKRNTLLWLGSAFRLLSHLEFLLVGNLTNVDALLGCPLAMYPLDLVKALEDVSDLPPATGQLLMLCTFHLVSWIREVVNAFASQVCLADLTSDTAPTSAHSKLALLADTRAKVVARFCQLQEVEVLLAGLASVCGPMAAGLPHLAQPLHQPQPTMSRGNPSLTLPTSTAKGSEGEGTARSTLTSIQSTKSWEATRQRLRPLHPSSYLALAIDQVAALVPYSPSTAAGPELPGSPCLVLMAEYLLTDLHSKMAAAEARGKAPGGLPGRFQPPDSPPWTLSALMAHIQPLLPALRSHMDNAVAVRGEPPQGGLAELVKGLPGDGQPSAALSTLDHVASALQPVHVALKLELALLKTWSLMFSSSQHHPPGFLRGLLEALGGPSALTTNTPRQKGTPGTRVVVAPSGPASPDVLLQAGSSAFQYLSDLRHRALVRQGRLSQGFSLQLEVALLRAQSALITALGEQAGSPSSSSISKTLQEMRSSISRAAGDLLEQGAQDQGPQDPGEGFSWKGQGPFVVELISTFVMFSTAPSETLLHICDTLLPAVPTKIPAKQQLEPHGGYSALTGATFTVWYRAALEKLVELMGKAARTAPGKHNKSSGPMVVDEDVDMSSYIMETHQCSQCFSLLMNLTKTHRNKMAVLVSAVKFGGKFIDVLLKMFPSWKGLYASQGQSLVAIIKEVQRGTKMLQTLCAESKSRGSVALAGKVPLAKKALERFVFMTKAFFHEVNNPDAFWMGNLKHRDLAGNAVASQMYPGAEDDEEEEEEEEEDGDEDVAEEDQVDVGEDHDGDEE